MTIQEKINVLVRKKPLSEVEFTINKVAKYIKSEFQRESNKIISDKRAIEILKGVKKKYQDIQQYNPDDRECVVAMNVIGEFLPKQVTFDEVKLWIDDNINFDEFKTPMQAMKSIMTEFKDRISGKIISDYLKKI